MRDCRRAARRFQAGPVDEANLETKPQGYRGADLPSSCFRIGGAKLPLHPLHHQDSENPQGKSLMDYACHLRSTAEQGTQSPLQVIRLLDNIITADSVPGIITTTGFLLVASFRNTPSELQLV